MSRKVKTAEIEAERIRKQAAELAAVVSEQAHLASKQAKLLAEHGKDWAGPRVEAAGAWAGPKAEKAWRDTVKVAAPKVEAATEKVRPAVDNAYERIVDDYLPRVSKAMHDAAEAAGKTDGLSAKAAVAGEAARKALSQPPKKSHGVVKTLGWVLVGTAAAGTGYLLWRRSQPIDDPWAEEYWDDTTVATPGSSATAGSTASTSGAAAAAASVVEKASAAAKKAGDAAKKAAEAAGGKAKNAADKGSDAVQDAADAAEKKADETSTDDAEGRKLGEL
ncbi:hypothetical protein [Georgenia muralis]|uniref:Uncharacterized protein n=1 Tax=Georgenia muralis TaxID=154117 RepID=A0A3N5A4S1_9MICO|nr:hypothetical protein [Georgenia muralis]RPF26781.1 hypothetical protein EDD32_1235 [Georgenia muralis]